MVASQVLNTSPRCGPVGALVVLKQLFSRALGPRERLALRRLPLVPRVPYGLAVRIPGFHPGGPGSTPGMGIDFGHLDLCREG